MNTAAILIKTDPQIKAKAQKTAASMGLSLTSVINRYLQHFIAAKPSRFMRMTKNQVNILSSLYKNQKKILKREECLLVLIMLKMPLHGWIKNKGYDYYLYPGIS